MLEFFLTLPIRIGLLRYFFTALFPHIALFFCKRKHWVKEIKSLDTNSFIDIYFSIIFSGIKVWKKIVRCVQKRINLIVILWFSYFTSTVEYFFFVCVLLKVVPRIAVILSFGYQFCLCLQKLFVIWRKRRKDKS